ncbi:MAG: Serine/threonine-protein kinase StkP [Planctomycetota bacterium]
MIMEKEKVLSQILDNEILTHDQVDQITDRLNRDSPTFIEAFFSIARENKWLTRWQTDQLAMGRVEGLRLGEFLLSDFLHRGRSSRIFRARSVVNGRFVALKVLTSQGQADEWVRKRLQNEFEVSQRFRSSFIAQCESLEMYQGRHTLVRSWVDGLSVRQFVGQRGRMDPKDSETFLADMAKGLDVLHSAGVRHGAVRAGHVIITPEMRPVWIDFGYSHEIAKGTPQNGTALPVSDFERATHARSGDFATDAYFLGCVCYELLSGGNPHPELEDDLRIKASLLRTYGSEIPLSSISNPPKASICRTVARMMDVHIERRLARISEIVEAFQRIQDGKDPETRESETSDDSLDTAELQRWLNGGGPTQESPSSINRSLVSQSATRAKESPDTGNVICVECQEEIQAEFRKTFEKLGWRARMVRNAETAQDMARERSPDLIVFDADGQGETAIEDFLELDRIAALGRRAPRGLLLLGPKQRKLRDSLPESIVSRYDILQKPLKMRAVKTSLISCAMG